jgi:hypothetical protein
MYEQNFAVYLHTISVTITQLYHCHLEAVIAKSGLNGHGCALKNLYL